MIVSERVLMPNGTWWSRWGSVVAMLVSVLMTMMAGTIWIVSEVRVLQADMTEVKRKLEQVEVVGRILDRYVADLMEHSDAARRPH